MLDPKFPGLLAYVGPGPGLELIPSFFSLLTWIGVAIGAVLLWPMAILWRRLRRGKEPGQQACESHSNTADGG